MTEMIEAGVPGLYAFHRGEERGGLGSRYVAAQEPERLAGIRAAIAFDRRGTSSIITHQSGERCCSEDFAASLSRAIGLHHQADPTGTFTDTANYTDLIGECTNISVGYDAEHTPSETLDLDYLLCLRRAILNIDVGVLVYARNPGEVELAAELDFAYEQDEVAYRRVASLTELVRNHPAAVADFLEMGGVTIEELEAFIECTIPF